MNNKLLKLNSVLRFGKYKESTVSEVIKGDFTTDVAGFDYLFWLTENTDYKLSQDVFDALYKRLDELEQKGIYSKTSYYGK